MSKYKVLESCKPTKGGYVQHFLSPSTIEEFDRVEGPRIITHINHPWDGDHKEVLEKSCIWLKTYGLKSFVINCPTSEVEAVIRDLSLIRP